MAAPNFLLVLIPVSLDNPSSYQASSFHTTMLSSLIFLILLTFCVLIATLYTILKNNSSGSRSTVAEDRVDSVKIQPLPLAGDEIETQKCIRELILAPDPEKLARSLLLEILPLKTQPKCDAIASEKGDIGDDPDAEDGSGQKRKKKKKRARRKKPDPDDEAEEEKGEKEKVLCSCPFTKSCSATQRKIKQQYDQLVKSHGSNGLKLEQIGQFVNCLVEARNELENKSEVIKRKFTITKALLFKADRSTIDRIRQQIHRLELEQKRLEEDSHVYNWLQEQLKLSPAYKKILEIGACIEMEEKLKTLEEDSADDCFSDVSFEELLEQEKKDAFWQKNGRMKSNAG